MEEYRYSSMRSEPWYYVVVSGHIYAAASTKQEAGWTPRLLWILHKRNIPGPCRKSN